MATKGAKLMRMAARLRRDGSFALVEALVERVWLRLGVESPSWRRFLRKKAADDAAFDTRFGVATGGVEFVEALEVVGPHRAMAAPHIASDPDSFRAMMARLDLEPAAATFVDYGSGRARVLLLAAAWRFRRVIGVEFAPMLHEAGLANVAAAASAGAVSGAQRIEQVLGDAAEFALPTGPLVLYLYNPFDAAVVAAVAARAMAAWRAEPRPLRVLYLNPVHGEEWERAGFVLRTRGRGRGFGSRWQIWSAPGDG